MSNVKSKRNYLMYAVITTVTAGIIFLTPTVYSKVSNVYEKIQILNQIIAIVNENYVEPVEWDKVLDGAFGGLLEKLDPHSAYIPKEEMESVTEMFEGKFEGIGIEFDILNGYITVISPISGSPSDRAGLQPGDQVFEINSISAYNITKDEVFKKLRGPKGTEVTLSVKRASIDEPFNVTIIRDEIPIHSLTSSFMIDEKTGYIRLNRFSSTTGEEVGKAIRELRENGMSQLIFDLRTNGGGYLEQAVAVADQFIVSDDTLVYTKGRRTDSQQVFRSVKSTGSENFALIILVNRWSASASEIVAGAIQDLDRGLIIGETTFGKGLVQRQYPLKDGSALRVTVSRYYTPSGRLIQRPYEDGTREYYDELTDERREEILDSLRQTSSVFKTKRGRIVYGGGGIAPDVYLATQKHSESVLRLIGHKNRYPFIWAEQVANKLKSQWPSLETFNNKFVVNDEQLEDFLSTVRDLKIEITNDKKALDYGYIKMILKAEIAGVLWGRSAYYEVLTAQESQVVTAMQYFDQASDLLSVK